MGRAVGASRHQGGRELGHRLRVLTVQQKHPPQMFLAGALGETAATVTGSRTQQASGALEKGGLPDSAAGQGVAVLRPDLCQPL